MENNVWVFEDIASFIIAVPVVISLLFCILAFGAFGIIILFTLPFAAGALLSI